MAAKSARRTAAAAAGRTMTGQSLRRSRHWSRQRRGLGDRAGIIHGTSRVPDGVGRGSPPFGRAMGFRDRRSAGEARAVGRGGRASRRVSARGGDEDGCSAGAPRWRVGGWKASAESAKSAESARAPERANGFSVVAGGSRHYVRETRA